MMHGEPSWIGKRLCSGRFEVREELGGGGMARVYRATDHHLGTDVVVKVPLRELVNNRDAVRRFLYW